MVFGETSFKKKEKKRKENKQNRELSTVLCDDIEGWNGREDGREAQERGDIHILMADS